MNIAYFLLVFVLVPVRSQKVGIGSCANAQVVTNFDVTQYLGQWYEIKRYPFIWEALGKCTIAEYSSNSDGSVGVYNKQINSIFQNKQTANGKATFAGSTNEAKLMVSFTGVPGSSPYWVLDTDYKNYAVVYSCSTFLFLKWETAWILARTSTLSDTYLNTAYSVLDKNGISRVPLLNTVQTGCPSPDY